MNWRGTIMIPLQRLKRKHGKKSNRSYAQAKDDESANVNYGDASEETTFIQETATPSPTPSDTGSYQTYARSSDSYTEYDRQHNQSVRRMLQIVRRVKYLKIVAIVELPLIIIMAAILFRYPHLIFNCSPRVPRIPSREWLVVTTFVFNFTSTVS